LPDGRSVSVIVPQALDDAPATPAPQSDAPSQAPPSNTPAP